jgi:hypothetical protein
MSFILPYHVIERRPQLRYQSISPHHILQFLLSFFLFAPTVVNLVLVCVWRNVGSGLSLRGRCHWSPDVVWVGVGGQCAPHAPAWGVWLAAAILRLILTAVVLVRHFTNRVIAYLTYELLQVVYFFASSSFRALRVPVSYRPEDVRRMDPVEISQIPQANAPSRPSLVVPPFVHKSGGFPQRSLSSSRMAVIPERSDTPNREHYEQENSGPDSAESSTLSDEEESKQRSAESSGTATTKSLRHTNSSRDVQMASSSSRLASLVANVGEEELQGFADQFRALVDHVSRELEESRMSEDQDREPHTPPLHHVLDTHTPYMTIDEFGREVLTEEPIAILGGVIKRMPTIESVGSRELMSLRSATLVSGGGGVGAASVAASSSASSRPPTGATMASFNDAASASLASASQPSSRSNSIHRLRTPSELGELVRDALRARAQARPLPPSSSARPGSGGSVSGSGSGCTGAGSGSGSGSGSGGSGESAVVLGPSALSRSRSNSLGPNEVLPPVTEHGELGREDSNLPLRRPPRRLGGGDVPGVAGGTVGASEMGEFSRTEWSRSWASNSPPSATSTTYFTASTSGSLVASGSGGGGDTGTGSSGSGPQTKT